MNMADAVAGVFCLILPLATMLVAIAALTWTRREFVSMLRKWIDAK